MSQTLSTQGTNHPDMEDTEIAHLAGFIDAVGSVTVHVSKNDSYKLGYNYTPVVRASRPMNDNDPLLGKLLEYADEQGVRYSLSEKSHAKDRDSMSYEFFCKRPDGVKRFLEPLLPYLVAKYEPALILLEHVIPRIEDGLHLEKEGFYELMEFADAIRQNDRQKSIKKYDQEYFANEWSITQ